MALIPQSFPNQAIIAEQTARAYELKLQGWSYRRIAEELQVSLGTAHNRVQAAIAQRVDPLVEEHRAIELDKLEEAEARLWEQIHHGGPKGLARNVEVLIKLSERRSKLVGMDAPERKEIAAQVETKSPELVALVEQAQAAQAQKEQQLREGRES